LGRDTLIIVSFCSESARRLPKRGKLCTTLYFQLQPLSQWAGFHMFTQPMDAGF
jgi:hypothetical protein